MLEDFQSKATTSGYFYPNHLAAEPWLDWLDKTTGLDEKTVRFGRTVDLLRPWQEMQNRSDGPPPEKKAAGP
jgi:hypothetical protein